MFFYFRSLPTRPNIPTSGQGILTPPNPTIPNIPTNPPINISDITKQGGGGSQQQTVPAGGGSQETLPSGTTKETLPGGGGYRITNNVNGGDPLKDNPKVVSTIGSLNYTKKISIGETTKNVRELINNEVIKDIIEKGPNSEYIKPITTYVETTKAFIDTAGKVESTLDTFEIAQNTVSLIKNEVATLEKYADDLQKS